MLSVISDQILSSVLGILIFWFWSWREYMRRGMQSEDGGYYSRESEWGQRDIGMGLQGKGVKDIIDRNHWESYSLGESPRPTLCGAGHL